MDALLIVDMQNGLKIGPLKHDLDGVVARINRLSADRRRRGDAVVFIQHCGGPGDDFEPGAPGWEILSGLETAPSDLKTRKTLNDPFQSGDLPDLLKTLAPDRVLITGWATDFCVDATVRSAVSQDHAVVVVEDCHTLSDRPHLTAPQVIQHHNWVWANLIARRPLRLATSAELIAEG